MRLVDRLVRLEGPKSNERQRQRQIEADAAEFDRRIAILAPRIAEMSPVDREEARWGWTIAKQMLRRHPGSAAAFAGMHPEDFRL